MLVWTEFIFQVGKGRRIEKKFENENYEFNKLLKIKGLLNQSKFITEWKKSVKF